MNWPRASVLVEPTSSSAAERLRRVTLSPADTLPVVLLVTVPLMMPACATEAEASRAMAITRKQESNFKAKPFVNEKQPS